MFISKLKIMNELAKLKGMDYGKKRREIIKNWFMENPDLQLTVDCRWCQQVKNDPDLKKLLKQGFLKRIRLGLRIPRRTFLVKR